VELILKATLGLGKKKKVCKEYFNINTFLLYKWRTLW